MAEVRQYRHVTVYLLYSLPPRGVRFRANLSAIAEMVGGENGREHHICILWRQTSVVCRDRLVVATHRRRRRTPSPLSSLAVAATTLAAALADAHALIAVADVPIAMGSAWSISFVSADGEEEDVPIDILSAASTVWRERLKLAGRYDEKCRSEEACDGKGIKAFVKMISHGTQEAVKNVDLETMAQSLHLVHKYDCTGTVQLLSSLEATHFPKLTSKDMAPGCVMNVVGREAGREDAGDAPSRRFYVGPAWLTQAHLDYIVLKQELFGVGSLNVTMKQILVYALSARIIKKDRGTHEATNKVFADMEEFAPKTKNRSCWLRFAAWRLQSSTLLALFALTQPADAQLVDAFEQFR